MASQTSSGSGPAQNMSRLLADVCALLGKEFEPTAAHLQQDTSASGAHPTEHLAQAFKAIGCTVTPFDGSIRRAVWLSREDSPVLLWSAAKRQWIIVVYAGQFRIRLTGAGVPETVSRSELVQLLGARNSGESVPCAVVHPQQPAAFAGIADTGDTHGDHGISPAARFLAILRAERGEVRTLLLFSLFYGVLHLAAPLAVDAVMSNLAFGAQQKPYLQALVILALALMACLALQALVSAFQHYVAEILQRRIFVRTAAEVAFRLPRVKASVLDQEHAPELVNRFLDVVTAQKNSALLLLDGVNLVVGGLMGMMLLAFYHPLLLAFVTVVLVLIVLVTFGLGRGTVRTSIQESICKYQLVDWFEQIAAAPFLFKGPGGADLAAERANEISAKYLQARSSHFRILMRQVTGLLTVEVLASAALLVLGGWLVVGQQLTVGQLVASELVMTSVAASLSKLGKKLESWYDAMAAMDKLGHVLDLELERSDGETPAARQGGLRVQSSSLSFGYEDGHAVFDNLSFTLEPGTRAVVEVPEGGGGSGLLEVLFGLRESVSGFLLLDGLDLRSWSLEGLRRNVQLARRDEVVAGSVAENLRLGRADIAIDQIREALDRVGLRDMLLGRKEGLGLTLKIGGAPLSSADRVRLILARAWVQRPRLLLVDGLLDGLRDSVVKELVGVLKDPARDWTVVVVTHRASVAALFETVITPVASGKAAEQKH
jgi:putative ABC transport system ATP-binding protein